MISDTLSDAVFEIDRYLSEMPDVYRGTMRRRIELLRDYMTQLREDLDTPPRED